MLCSKSTTHEIPARAKRPDPVFAAIERHRQAVQAWFAALEADAANGRYNPLTEAIADAALNAERDACLSVLSTVPTTLAGAIAALDYAASPAPVGDGRTILSDWDGEPSELVKRFPAMIAAALRQIGN